MDEVVLALPESPAMPTTILKGWTHEALDKARMYELATHLSSLAALYCPELLHHALPFVKRLAPVRLSPGARHLRAWGRDYRFSADDAANVRRLVRAWFNGTRFVVLGEGVFAEHPAMIDGVIQRSGGTYWIEEPHDEKAKPRLVVIAEVEPEEASKKSRALALLIEHPDWSDTKIAQAVPCSRTTLYSWHEFKMAREAMETGRQRFSGDR